MKSLIRSLALILFILVALNAYADGFIELEAGVAFTGYNDVQIPSDTGTRLSLATDTDSEPALALRVRAGYTFADRHTVMFLAAPLTVRGTGTLDESVSYYGVSFPAGTEVESEYRFDSYRLTYKYTFLDNNDFTLAAGLTGKVRSADIALMYESGYARRTDLGVVPLIHLMAEWKATPEIGLLLDADALVTPFGRAEDVLAALQYRQSDRVSYRVGYRVLEGGSDGGGGVYTFALFHYITAGMTVRF
ncbi:MAG: hypothetical protein AB7T74_07770 [Clostridia bacterium]